MPAKIPKMFKGLGAGKQIEQPAPASTVENEQLLAQRSGFVTRYMRADHSRDGETPKGSTAILAQDLHSKSIVEMTDGSLYYVRKDGALQGQPKVARTKKDRRRARAEMALASKRMKKAAATAQAGLVTTDDVVVKADATGTEG